MHNLVPQFIQDNFARNRFRGEFSAVGLFVDMSGFSAMTDALMQHGPYGAELLAGVMRGIFTPLAESVYAYGGFVAGLAGDAFTAFFPILEGDASVYWRAVSASWRIQQKMSSSGVQMTPFGKFIIQAKVGLGAGEVAWGIINSQSGQRSVYYFQGPALEGASGGEHLALPGQIILDGRVLGQVRDRVEVEPVQSFYRLGQLSDALATPGKAEALVSDRSITAHFYPEAVLELELAGEFRHVVNLFINLPTIRNEAQLSAFMQTVFDLQDHYGGLLNKLDFGDKGSNILILWGTPTTYENDIDRALNFILGLQSMTSIPVNAGMTYYIAHTGFIGSPYLEDYTGYGRGVNLAARFMTSAARGEIWVDEQVFRRGKGFFEFEDLGKMAFKGFSEPQQVFVLVERIKQPEHIYSGEIVGREAELARLADFYAPLCRGEYVGAMVVIGEAGIGKSRLVHEFQVFQQCSPDGFLWAVCQTDEILREPLNPFRYWLQNLFDQSEIQPEARNKRNFNRVVDELILKMTEIDQTKADALDRMRSFLGAVVGLHWPDSLYEQLDPQGRYENTLLALASLFQVECILRPVVMIIEDIQWLDPVSKEFIGRLDRITTSDKNRSYPLALIATARPEETSPILGEGMSYQELRLTGITGKHILALVENILGAPPAPELLRILEARCEGNPFYVEQVVRYLQEARRLTLEAGKWQVRGEIDASVLPTSVQALLVARLDRLATQVRSVVQTAAIIGREFEVRILAHMLQDTTTLIDRVHTAAEAAIWTTIDDKRYIFNHLMMQDAAYHMLLRAERQELHKRAVEAMESLFVSERSTHLAELAHHSELAGLPEKARGYLKEAAVAARAAYQNQQAIAYFSRALDFTPETELEERFQLLLAREGLYFVRGDLEGQRADLEALSHLVDRFVGETLAEMSEIHQAEVLERWAGYYLQINHYPQAIEIAEKAVSRGLSAKAYPTAISAYMTWSAALERHGEFELAIQRALAALDLARQSSDLRGQAQSLNMLGNIYWDQDDLEPANRSLVESLEIARQTGFVRIEAMALTNLGNLASTRGDLIAGRDYYIKALNITREIGERAKEGVILGNLGWITGMLGDYPKAQAYCEQNAQILREVGDQRGESMALINLSAYAGRQGDYPTALEFAEQALGMAGAAGDPSAEAWALTYLGHARLGSDELELARQAYEFALEIRRRLDQPALAAEPLAGLARAAASVGDVRSALDHVAEILSYLEQGGSLGATDEPLRVYLTCYQVLKSSQDPRADRILETSFALLQEQAAKIKDDSLRRVFLENVPYHREILEAWEGRTENYLPPRPEAGSIKFNR